MWTSQVLVKFRCLLLHTVPWGYYHLTLYSNFCIFIIQVLFMGKKRGKPPNKDGTKPRFAFKAHSLQTSGLKKVLLVCEHVHMCVGECVHKCVRVCMNMCVNV